MLRIFVYEFNCAGPVPAAHPSWLREGRAMLAAVLADFRQIPSLELTTILGKEHAAVAAGVDWQLVKPGREETAFRAAAGAADYSLVIAPESADLLITRCGWALEGGSRLLGSDLTSIALTADKLALCRHLREHGVPTPDTEHGLSSPPLFPVVAKPRHGAGSMETLVIDHEAQWRAFAAQPPRLDSDEFVIQPYLAGQAASMSFLLGPKQQLAFPAGAQHLSADGRLSYLGGRIPLPEPYQSRVRVLASRAVGCVPGLCGYVGVDVVLGSAPDGSEDYAIEINPRLTTSYIGLRALASTNLAEAMLRIVRGEDVEEPAWRNEPLTFTAEGHVIV
jgi:predicted ATP-grasp superfamily ATP-dependent carboligase